MAEHPEQGGMPEFVMPPEAAAVAPPEPPAGIEARDGAAARGPSAPGSGPDLAGGPPPQPSITWTAARGRDGSPAGAPARGRPSLRLLAVVGTVGVVLGSLIPGGIQLADRAAAESERASVERAALAYLTAIAEGRAEDATALVAVRAETALLVDAVLGSAERIADPAASMVLIEGDEARVEVGYALGGVDVSRTLEAVREGGAWRITTSLAESVTAWDSGATAAIGGVAVPQGSFRLYPGVYEVEGSDDGIVEVASTDVRADGDPATTTELYLETRLASAIEEEAGQVALGVVEACLAALPCADLPGPGELHVEQAYLWGRNVSGGGADAPVLDIGVTVSVTDMGSAQAMAWTEVGVRLHLEEGDGGRRWECLPPGVVSTGYADTDFVACGP